MGSRTRQTTIKKGAPNSVRGNIDRLSTRETHVLRMRHGWDENLMEPVGSPPSGCSRETIKRVQAIENRVLDRARGKKPYARPESVKQKIILALKKKS